MQKNTISLIDAIMRADGSISQGDRQRMLAMLNDESTDGMDKLLKRSQAARILGRSPRAIDRLVERGILNRVRFPACKRAAGFRASDVARLIAGTGRTTGICEKRPGVTQISPTARKVAYERVAGHDGKAMVDK